MHGFTYFSRRALGKRRNLSLIDGMPHYFFDTRDGADFIEDDEGFELPDIEAAKVQAATSLAELARDVLPGSVRRELAVEVRVGVRQVLIALLRFEAVIVAT